MSGVAGFCAGVAGPPADPKLVQRLLEAMRHKDGGEGPARWSHVGVGLGATASLRRDSGGRPLVQTGGDGSAIVFDGRLDNRGELAEALGAPPDATDEALLLSAYSRWGTAFLDRLLGDFALALWDMEERRLLVARDPFGVRPLCYVEGSYGLVFASEVQALLSCGLASSGVDDVSVAAFIEGRPPAPDRTCHADIRRLPPGCLLVVSPGKRAHTETHYRLDASRPFAGASAADAFREVFGRAVESRLQAGGDVAAMLSGGLDSSSIVAVAAPRWSMLKGRPMATLSRLYDEEVLSERRYVDAVVARSEVDSIVLVASDERPLDDAARMLEEQGGPFIAPNISFTRPIYRAARGRGVVALLDGHGGDEVVSYGWQRLGELARARRWRALWRELDGGDLSIRQRRYRMMAEAIAYYSFARPVLRRLHQRLVQPAVSRRTSLAASDLLASVAGSGRPDAMPRPTPRDHLSMLTDDFIPHSFEVLDVIAAREGVELRFPFWDRRLVELCLSLPSEEKLDGGWSRLVLRRAMEGRLPPKVQWRRDKLNFGPTIAAALLDGHRSLLNDIFLAPDAKTAAYVDIGRARSTYRRLVERRTETEGDDVQAVWRIAMLAIWLRGGG